MPMSARTEELLTAAGWNPGRCIDTSGLDVQVISLGYVLDEVLLAFLREFSGFGRYTQVLPRGEEHPPTAEDFVSNKAKGRKPMPMEVAHPELYEGISVWDDLQVAREKMAGAKSVTHIAEVEIPDGVGILKQTTANPHHYTWWVDPADAVPTVTGIMTKE